MLSKRVAFFGAVVALLFAVVSTPAAAKSSSQSPASVAGVVLHSLTGEPLAGALVVLESTAGNREVQTGADGRFAWTGVAPGPYHLTVRADGFLLARQAIDVPAGGLVAPLEVKLNPELHFSEVTSVSPDARSQFESYQPTNVLGGQDLAKVLQGTLGATLDAQPGMATRGFGPGPARPVIRGLDGDRVLVLEDGQRMGDLSSQSGDHGINVNPAAAEKIEVVRGPASLLYGANAIGGLVNVVTRNIPTARVSAATGTLTFDSGSAAREANGAGEFSVGRGNMAFHFSGNAQRTGDYRSPDGRIANSFNRGGAAQAGASYVTDNGYLGASVGYDRSHYGIPLVEAGQTNLDPRRKTLDLRAERRNLPGFIGSFRVTGNIRRYRHDERDGDQIATAFTNNTSEFEVMANHRQAGRLKGAFGGWGMTRSFLSEGEEALSPRVNQRGVAGFFYEEATLSPHASLQFGGRLDHASFSPDGLAARQFTNFSGSAGVLLRPGETTTLAVSLARASRNPALEELYFNGPHAGNNAFEVGVDTLQSEHATGIDISLRHQAGRASGEIAYFYNRVGDFIFRRLTGEVSDDLPVAVFSQGNAVLQGIESHLDVRVSNLVAIEGGLDYVRGDLITLDVPLPRMPPLRGRLGVRVQHNALQAGLDLTMAAAQNRVFRSPLAGGAFSETPTDGYGLSKAYLAYTFGARATLSTLAIRIDNLTNERYRNHLNYLKDLALEQGRDLRVTYSVKF